MTKWESIQASKDAITADYAAGKTAEAIARERECSKSYIAKALNAWGIDTGHRPVTDGEREAIVQHGRDGLSACQAAKLVGVSHGFARKVMKDAGVYVSHKRVKEGEPLEANREKIIQMYLREGLGVDAIGKEFGVAGGTIRGFLKVRGVKIRPLRYYAHPVNESFYDKIDTEEKAYCLGIMMADGSVSDRPPVLRLAMTDRDAVENVAKAMGFGGPIDTLPPSGKGKLDQYRICIGSRKLSDAIVRLGCVPRKSRTATFPTEGQVPFELHDHLLRGWFEGDGALYYQRKNDRINTWCWFICGTDEVCRGVADSVFRATGVVGRVSTSGSVGPTGHVTWKCQVHSRDNVKAVTDWLYRRATVSMGRKRRKYEEFLREKFPGDPAITP